uniref:Putative secreted peptide n=1 Tax=Anopheles braziliensis TaxID=58242 RepID=A0A2M3ZR62_9DIPT
MSLRSVSLILPRAFAFVPLPFCRLYQSTALFSISEAACLLSWPRCSVTRADTTPGRYRASPSDSSVSIAAFRFPATSCNCTIANRTWSSSIVRSRGNRFAYCSSASIASRYFLSLASWATRTSCAWNSRSGWASANRAASRAHSVGWLAK